MRLSARFRPFWSDIHRTPCQNGLKNRSNRQAHRVRGGKEINLLFMDSIRKTSPKIAKLLEDEKRKPEETITLIPSENIISEAVRMAQASFFANKYAEGYPGRRYYPGNENSDKLESLVQEMALETFQLSPKKWKVNVQPYSGSPANLEVYSALLSLGDTIMGLGLSDGGHLTHGHKVNFSGKAYKAVRYTLDTKTGFIDYDNLAKLARTEEPKIIISGATAYSRKINFKKIGEIAKRVGAYHMADISHIAGLVAAGLHPSPFPWADIVTTTTHKTLRGPRAAMIFSKANLSDMIDKAVFPGMQGGPHLNVIAAIGVALDEARKQSFRIYQKNIINNARVLSEELKDYGFDIVAGGTDNHLMLLDLKNKHISGIEAEKILERAGIIANRNTVPGDVSAFNPSGIRLGTPSVTTRGMKTKEMEQIAKWIAELINEKRSPQSVNKEVKFLVKKFPLN